VRRHTARAHKLARPDLIHVQSTDLMLLTTTVRTLHQPATTNMHSALHELLVSDMEHVNYGPNSARDAVRLK